GGTATVAETVESQEEADKAGDAAPEAGQVAAEAASAEPETAEPGTSSRDPEARDRCCQRSQRPLRPCMCWRCCHGSARRPRTAATPTGPAQQTGRERFS